MYTSQTFPLKYEFFWELAGYKVTLTDALLFYFPERAVSEVGSDTSI